MFSKTIFVLATLCVVNASVISGNVFDDDPETEVASNPKDCNVRACDQLCRRLKFPGGACVNGRCKCDNFRNAEDEVSVKTLSDKENSVLQTDDSEAENAVISSRCNLKVCDRVCRWLKKTSGACVDGRCKCAKSIIAEDDSEAEVAAISSRCNLKVCDRVCRWLKKTSGACANGRCKCAKSIIAEDDMTDSAEFTSPGDCNYKACAQQCFRLGFPGGACVSGRCKCDNFLNTEDAVTENTLSNLEDSISPKRCTYQACNELCRKHKFPGGACVNGRCKCDNFFGTEDAADEYSEFSPRRACRLTKCNRTCIRRGYECATCVYGRCKCFNKTQAEDMISETSLPVSELSEDQTERGCNMRVCDQLCRRLKFPGGACVNGRCKCDHLSGTEDSSPVNDLTSNENEESNVSLRTNEEELIVPSHGRGCNTVTCNQMCRRLKYAGGWCRFGQCQCF